MLESPTVQDDQIIEYERDPSNSSTANIRTVYNQLQAYNQINKTQKLPQKRPRKTFINQESQKQRSTETHNFSNILKRVRRNNIVQQFVNKLKLNITLSNLNAADQIQYFSIGKTSVQEDFRKKIRQGKIHKLIQNENFDIITSIFKFFTILGIFYINSLKIAFHQLHSLDIALSILIIFSLSFFLMQMIGMFKTIHNMKIPCLKNFVYWVEIEHLLWQIIIHFMLILQLVNFPWINPMILGILTPQVFIQMKKFKKVENSFVLSINLQRYWNLLKIILFNFCIAHILSIVLNLMGSINIPDKKSWYDQKKIGPDQDWVVKYIWGYYWGTNIMLTVGFGDISAQNHIQAIILVFIETFSCMIMAYNVSQVSKILQDISEMDQQKKLKFKVFNQMSKKYQFEDDFKSKIINHIDKSIQKNHQLTCIEESLIEKLPEKIKLEVKRQVNKNVFQEALFFKNLTRKTQNLLAQKVNKIFAHPEEIILKNMQTWKILILRQGSVALTFKKGSSVNNGTIIQQFTVQQITKPELLSLKFIRKNHIKGDLKSLDFSILSTLEMDQFESILREHDPLMFEFYCSERDKTQYHQFDLQIRKCSICFNLKHDKIDCPRMHFIPLKQHIIYKRKSINGGIKVKRNEIKLTRKKNKQNSLKIYSEYGKEEVILKNPIKTYSDILLSTLQFMSPTINEGFDIVKKLDKCLQKLDEGLKIMKGVADSQELIVDKAFNFRRYFTQNNPDNLMLLCMDSTRGSGKTILQKKARLSIL